MAFEYIAGVNEALEIAQRYAGSLEDKLHLNGVYLFGSYASGAHHDDSDIDIAIVSDSFTGNLVEDRANLLFLKYDIDNRIEPHPFLPKDFTSDNPLAEEILSTGIRIA